MKKITVALAGNPNSGKTTIFNLLTGARQHVGNYPGVTVEVKEGICKYSDYEIRFIDLPGTYSLTAYSIELAYRLHRLHPLRNRIAYQTHPPQFTGNKKSWHIGFKIRIYIWDVHAAPFCSEDKRDRVHGAGRFAGTVADAVGRTYDMAFALYKAEDRLSGLFRAGINARPATDAPVMVDHRMQRLGFGQTGTVILVEYVFTSSCFPASPSYIKTPDHDNGEEIRNDYRCQIGCQHMVFFPGRSRCFSPQPPTFTTPGET